MVGSCGLSMQRLLDRGDNHGIRRFGMRREMGDELAIAANQVFVEIPLRISAGHFG